MASSLFDSFFALPSSLHDCQYKKEYFRCLTLKEKIVEVGIWEVKQKLWLGNPKETLLIKFEPAKSFLLRVWQSMAGVFSPKHFHCNHNLELLASIWYLGTSWAIQKKSPVVLGICRGWNPTQLNGDYSINHDIRIPIKQSGWLMEGIRVFLFVAQLGGYNLWLGQISLRPVPAGCSHRTWWLV